MTSSQLKKSNAKIQFCSSFFFFLLFSINHTSKSIPSIGQPNNDKPCCRIAGCTFIYLWTLIELSPRLLVATYFYVANQSKFVTGILFLRSCKVMQHCVKLCNVTQCHATSWKVMRSHVIMQGNSHTRFVKFTLLCDVLPEYRRNFVTGE